MQTAQNIVQHAIGVLVLLYILGYVALRAQEVIAKRAEESDESESEAESEEPGRRGSFDYAQQRRRAGKGDAPLWGVAATINEARKAVVDRINGWRRPDSSDDERDGDDRRRDRRDEGDDRRDRRDRDDREERDERRDRDERDGDEREDRDRREGEDSDDERGEKREEEEGRRWQDRRDGEQPEPDHGEEQPRRGWRDRWKDRWKDRRGSEESDEEYWARRRGEHTVEQTPRYVPHSPQLERPIHVLDPPREHVPERPILVGVPAVEQPSPTRDPDVEVIDVVATPYGRTSMSGTLDIPGTGAAVNGVGFNGGMAGINGGGGTAVAVGTTADSHEASKELARKITQAMKLTQDPITEALLKARATLKAMWDHVEDLVAAGVRGKVLERWCEVIVAYEAFVGGLAAAARMLDEAEDLGRQARGGQARRGDRVQAVIEEDRASTARLTSYY